MKHELTEKEKNDIVTEWLKTHLNDCMNSIEENPAPEHPTYSEITIPVAQIALKHDDVIWEDCQVQLKFQFMKVEYMPFGKMDVLTHKKQKPENQKYVC